MRGSRHDAASFALTGVVTVVTGLTRHNTASAVGHDETALALESPLCWRPRRLRVAINESIAEQRLS